MMSIITTSFESRPLGKPCSVSHPITNPRHDISPSTPHPLSIASSLSSRVRDGIPNGFELKIQTLLDRELAMESAPHPHSRRRWITNFSERKARPCKLANEIGLFYIMSLLGAHKRYKQLKQHNDDDDDISNWKAAKEERVCQL
jgi:hypothetical protein